MSVLVRVSVPPEDFGLERTLNDHEALKIDIERVVPLGEGFVPYLWLTGISPECVRAVLLRDGDVARAEVLDRVGETVLARIVWAAGDSPFFDALVAMDATCLQSVGRKRAWHLELRFPSRQSVSEFYRDCVDAGISIRVDGIHDQVRPDDSHASDVLSGRQQEALRVAFESGYFSIPRDITLQELAERLGISDTAASQRIRRGLQTLLAEERGWQDDDSNISTFAVDAEST